MSLRAHTLFVAVFALVAGAAGAQPFAHTYVSKLGSDANTCGSQIAPCRTITAALGRTVDGGEISVLDATVSQPVLISQSVTIDGTGAGAGINVGAGSAGIKIAGGAADKVVLRNLSINGFGAGGFGIQVTGAGQVTVESCRISGVDVGIRFVLITTGRLYVTDTNITNVDTGIVVGSSTQAVANLDNVRIENVGTTGVRADTNASVTIFRSTLSRGSGVGVMAFSSISRVDVLSSLVEYFEGTAIFVPFAGGVIRLSSSDIINNKTAIAFGAGAVVESDGNNRVAGFDFNTPPNATIALQ